MQEAESEVRKTTEELQALREDLQSEEELLRASDEGIEVEQAISSAREDS